MIQNMTVYETDAVILDLEDSVLHYEKDAARTLIKNFLTQIKLKDIDVFVRLNNVDSPFFEEDINILESTDIKGYVLPKASIETVKTITTMTTKLVLPIIESPLAVLDARDIIQHKQVIGLLLGAEDLTKEMNIKRTKEGNEIDYARKHVAMVCHAYHKEAIDTPWVDKDNEVGLHRDAQYAKSLGFTGKALIHPNHVDTINAIFVPSNEEILQAKRIVAKANETNKGAFSLDGQMIDVPIIEKAKQLLAIAKRYDLL